jgi:hypothetical protein
MPRSAFGQSGSGVQTGLQRGDVLILKPVPLLMDQGLNPVHSFAVISNIIYITGPTRELMSN